MSTVIIKQFITLSISESSRQEINQKVPNVGQELSWLAELPQEWIDHLGGPESRLPVAKVCLLDAANVASQTNYALAQAYAHVIWFSKECADAPRESEAHHYGRFYADDAALRLYSAAEHMANFIVEILNVSAADLQPYVERNTSRAAQVGNYLRKQKPNHQITAIVTRLQSEEWKLVREYRNNWVHDKPPILDSPGLDYKRANRWFTVGETKMLLMGAQYTPNRALDELLDAIVRAASEFKAALTGMTDVLFQELESLGIKRDVEAGIITPPTDFWNR